ncbi:hypothetical protein HDV02_004083, partial [Globomyces sp. JEL0801]
MAQNFDLDKIIDDLVSTNSDLNINSFSMTANHVQYSNPTFDILPPSSRIPTTSVNQVRTDPL